MTNNFSCIVIDDEQHAVELLTDRLAHLYKNISVIATFNYWEDALAGLRTLRYDLLFLDISMPGKNAIDLLKLLPRQDSEIIFVTAHECFAIEAFAFAASGYILKPVGDAELSAAVNKAMERITDKKLARHLHGNPAPLNDKIGISHNHGIDYINIGDIVYLESVNKCTKIATAKSEHLSSQNLGKFLNLTSTHTFFQVHRSYIINLTYVLRYESSGIVIMSNKTEIPVSRNMRNDFLRVLNGAA